MSKSDQLESAEQGVRSAWDLLRQEVEWLRDDCAIGLTPEFLEALAHVGRRCRMLQEVYDSEARLLRTARRGRSLCGAR